MLTKFRRSNTRTMGVPSGLWWMFMFIAGVLFVASVGITYGVVTALINIISR